MRNLWTLVCVIVIGCGSGKPASKKPGGDGDGTGSAATKLDPGAGPAKSLYDRLGGKPAITAVVDEFVNRTTTDPRIMQRFFNTDADNLKELLVEFVCKASGGPCDYTGRDMATAHAGMDLVDDEFNALVENLKAALDKFKVPATEQGQLLGAIAPLHDVIVVSPDKLKPIDAAKLEAVTKLSAGLTDKGAQDLLAMAVIAGGRGQQSYAEQLFTRAELLVGPKALASVASTFRAGAPPRVTTALKSLPKDTPAQPAEAGNSDEDAPAKKPEKGSLTGVLQLDGKPLGGLGVVMLSGGKGGKKRTAKHRVIEQRDKKFAPHVTAVPVGSTIAFPNFDPIYHNVFSLSHSKAFDLGMYKNGELREVVFDKPGIIRLGCNLHASMSAYVIVVDAPHYAVVGDDGSFSFKSLAPGKYKVKAWSEQGAEPTETSIEIKPGTNEATVDLKGGVTVGISPDKFGAARDSAAP